MGFTVNQPAPCVFVIDGVMKNTKAAIEISLKSEGWRDATVVGHEGESETNKNIRSNRILEIPYGLNYPSEWFKINQLMWLYTQEYARYFEIPLVSMEGAQLLHYQEGTFYTPHYDYISGGGRVCSSLLYLNDVEEGGETYFTNFDVAVQPKSGRMVIFPANYAYLHEARPPISGEKFVAVSWYKG